MKYIVNGNVWHGPGTGRVANLHDSIIILQSVVQRVRGGAHITMIQSLTFRARHGEAFMYMVVWFDLDVVFWYIIARFNHHFPASAEGAGQVWCCPWTRSWFVLLFISFFLGNSGVRLSFFILTSRDYRISNCVDYCLWSLLDISSTSWIEFDGIRHKWVLLTIVPPLCVYLQSRHEDIEMQSERDTERHREGETQGHKDIETRRYKDD